MVRFITNRPRLFIALAAGALCYPVLPHDWLQRTRLLCCWDTGVLVYLALIGALFASEHQDRMASDAKAQQEGEWTIFAITVAVVLASFIAIFGEFGHAKDLHGTAKDAHIALVTVTLAASWLMLQASFCLRYAHEFYTSSQGSSPDGGLEFPGEKQPDYLDFTYFAVVLGMTFQVSDVQITSRTLRRLATLHGLLSFLFNTVIVALTVNIGASLL